MEQSMIITVKNLVKRYGRSSALRGLSMQVPRGSVYGIVGSNGAGKTTLLRVLCGLQRPTGGTYAVCGASVGALIEKPALWENLSVRENLRQQRLLLGLPDDEGVEALLALVGLESQRAKKAKRLSLGMRQRLGIALALAGNPQILFLDEPTNGLDPRGVVFLRGLIARLNRERGMTIVVASHNLDELARVATHFGVMDGGRMLKEMPASELQGSLEACFLALTGGDVHA